MDDKDLKSSMHAGAPSSMFTIAKHLRENMTSAEKILWNELQKGPFKVLNFRRQHPFLRYILDFYCHKIRLCIEIDGIIHDKPQNLEYDQIREDHLKEFGIEVIRFRNDEIYNNLDEVIKKIQMVMNELLSKNNV